MGQSITVKAGKPINIAIDSTGLPPGEKVKFEVYEPYGLGGDPIDKFEVAVTEADPHKVVGKWTYDHKKLKDKVSGSTFFIVTRAGKTAVSISPPIEVVETLEMTVKDSAGTPLAKRKVVLRPARGKNVEAETDEDGKLKVDVPPGDYRVDVASPAPELANKGGANGEEALSAAPKVAAAGAGVAAATDHKKEEDVAESGEEQEEEEKPLGGSGAGGERTQFLSVRFLDKTGRAPAAGLKFKVEGVEATTDADGHAVVPKMPWQVLECVFDKNKVYVPAVADAKTILEVRLRFSDSGKAGEKPLHDDPERGGASTWVPENRDPVEPHPSELTAT